MQTRSDMLADMILARHSIGIAELLQGSYIMLAAVMIAGFLICASIAFIACFINRQKIKRELRKEGEDTERE